MMKICGLQKTTLLDFPGHVAATAFLGVCNLRCPFCHNSELLDAGVEAVYSSEEILSFLKKRAPMLDGVCITGGEPTLFPDDLRDFISRIRSLGLMVKLDTNGFQPKVLKELCADGLLDYVAVDIKSSKRNYPLAAGVRGLNLSGLEETVDFLKHGAVDYEFRTTAVKGIHTLVDFREIGPWIAGCRRYFIQNYTDSPRVLSPGFSSFTKDELLEFAAAVSPFVEEVALRGIDY